MRGLEVPEWFVVRRASHCGVRSRCWRQPWLAGHSEPWCEAASIYEHVGEESVTLMKLSPIVILLIASAMGITVGFLAYLGFVSYFYDSLLQTMGYAP